jgi:hypothetical protein
MGWEVISLGLYCYAIMQVDANVSLWIGPARPKSGLATALQHIL